MDKKSTKSNEIKKPHHYGKRSGVHLFHATMPEHRELIGKHIDDPSDDQLNDAISEAKHSGVSCVVIHGAAPESLRAKIHQEAGPVMKKSYTFEVTDQPLTKAEKKLPPQANAAIKPVPGQFFHPDLLSRKTVNLGYGDVTTAGHHPVSEEGLHHHLTSGSYSLLTAHNPSGIKTSPEENMANNQKLQADLDRSGAVYHKVKGTYGGNEEQSYLVHHTRDVQPHHIEELGRKYGQESVIHSSLGQHKMVYVTGPNAGKHNKGAGHSIVPRANENYSQIGSNPNQKFSLDFNFDSLHHEDEMQKTEKVYFRDLKKAFLQNDAQTFTDIKAHTQAVAANHPALMEWGAKKLSALPKDAVESMDLNGHTIKVRKHDADLYSGWIEKDGNKVHGFEKITMPELMSQLQSKLELYGKEEPAVKQSLKDLVAEIFKLGQAYYSESGHDWDEKSFAIPATKQKLETLKAKVSSKMNPEPFDETREDEVEEQKEFKEAGEKKREEMTFDELNELEDQIKEIHEEHTESVPKKELTAGMLQPERQCEDCGSKASFCDCYQGLPRPRLEFDGKKVTIFFKSEWAQEDRENFVEDLKRRAGQLLKSRRFNK